MFPAAFDQENNYLSAPKGCEDEVTPLSVYQGPDHTGQPIVISCWKCTKEELEEINKTGRVWLIIMGPTMPPAVLSGENPFEIRNETK